jgi:hypothetical protein
MYFLNYDQARECKRVQVGRFVPATVHFGLRRSINGLPACTTSFGLTNTFSTTHPAISSSALTGISSFIASRIVTTFSFSILSPSLISTFHTLALSGASMGVISGSVQSQLCIQKPEPLSSYHARALPRCPLISCLLPSLLPISPTYPSPSCPSLPALLSAPP